MQSKHALSTGKYLWIFCTLLCSLLASGCKNYSVSVNDNLVYVPPSIFKDYTIADQRLFDCVEQTIYDKKITRAEDLTSLNCSNAAIKSLKGLEKFFALKELNLAENQIDDIATLAMLGRLENLKLNGNQIKDATALLNLLHLKQLDLQENDQLNCKSLQQVVTNLTKTAAQVLAPEQCIN
ncbi:leucine-rich repeat domain-containing protein [Cellvibrio fontiphilus]|uniref:Leucine-rich repeat domain-containing protein n=1 Tax=Cellvibrio fontiphilus TaxID=1815559 RepID=A0ABV7FCS0_9GAMM